MKKIIVITPETILHDEATLIKTALDAGAYRVHLRKPTSTQQEVGSLLQAIPAHYHPQIVLHDFHMLSQHYAIGGLHINNRVHNLPHNWQGSVSCSCHSISEVMLKKHACNYLFISPIYNSISKPGYDAQFTHETLLGAAKSGIIDEKVIALGGINVENAERLIKEYHFGGIALLGAIWNNPSIDHITATILRLKTILQCYNT